MPEDTGHSVWRHQKKGFPERKIRHCELRPQMAIDFQSCMGTRDNCCDKISHCFNRHTKLSQITLPLNMVSKLNVDCGGGGHFSCVCVAHTVRLTSLSQCRVVALSQNPRCCRQVQHLVAKPNILSQSLKFCRKAKILQKNPKFCRKSKIVSKSPKCCRKV